VHRHALRGLVVTHIAFGDLFLPDIRQYREERLAGTGSRRRATGTASGSRAGSV